MNEKLELRMTPELCMTYLLDYDPQLGDAGSHSGAQLMTSAGELQSLLESCASVVDAVFDAEVDYINCSVLEQVIDSVVGAGMSVDRQHCHMLRLELALGRWQADGKFSSIFDKLFTVSPCEDKCEYTIHLLDEHTRPAFQRKWCLKVVSILLMSPNKLSMLQDVLNTFAQLGGGGVLDPALLASLEALCIVCKPPLDMGAAALQEKLAFCRSTSCLFHFPFVRGSTGKAAQGEVFR